MVLRRMQTPSAHSGSAHASRLRFDNCGRRGWKLTAQAKGVDQESFLLIPGTTF